MTLSIALPTVSYHPNLLRFQGCLALLDRPSDKAPTGARKHRVILTRQAAEAALPSLLGMAVNYRDGWTGHNARQKCGIITAAFLKGSAIGVEGILYSQDYPEISAALSTQDLGMSYEMSDAHIVDMQAAIWTISRTTFTGAAILLRDKAAYRNTYCKAAA